jgi:Flp pilus assembly pilin Flp
MNRAARLSFRSFLSDDSGQATSEYVLLVALIIVPLARVFREFGDVLRDLLALLNGLVFGPGV